MEPTAAAGMPSGTRSAPAPMSMSPTTAPHTTNPASQTVNETEHAQETYSGAPEPESLSPTNADVERNMEENPMVGEPGQMQSPVEDDGQAQGGGKLPFKEQVKAYAKVHRGTLLGDKQTKETGQKILAGEISPEAATTSHK
ncbi:hypothetical protein DL93DRAFT_2090794 [Clavulina sp. PMI_390]|nr:hypothetical protein DL93DRAFT_2090794 [Clavulina sp. PMI_390]